MNEDEEADADDLASDVDIDLTRHKIRRDLQNLGEESSRVYSFH